MLKPLLVSALGAGLLAGIFAALLQFWLLVPVIGQAELYESGAVIHFAASDFAHVDAEHNQGAHEHDGPPIPRALGTLIFTITTYLGFALVLVAGFALADRLDAGPGGQRDGLLWGLAGFAATSLLPALGLPPELPGAAGAALEARQTWWLMTAVLSAAGLAILELVSSPARWAGLLLLAAPHLIGAPHADFFNGVTPPEMAALFAARALGVSAIAWAVLGATAGWLWHRQSTTT